MVKLFGKTLLASAAILAVAGCTRSDGRVYERVLSPDGSLEAVLMLCPMDSDPKLMLLSGGVFSEKGKGCNDLSKDARAGFQSSRAPEGEEPAARIEWVDGKAIYELDGDRSLANRFAQGGVPLDLIQLKGSFDEADIVTED